MTALRLVEKPILGRSEDTSHYTVIPAHVRYNKSLAQNAKLLYGEIMALCRKDGCCRVSKNYFAELYGVQRSSISSWIKSLINEGYITVEKLTPAESFNHSHK